MITSNLNKKQLENSLFEGDCLKVMSKFPDNSIDMILCDLPYGTTQNKWDSVIPLDILWKEYERIIKKNGVIALTSQGVFTAQLKMSIGEPYNKGHRKNQLTGSYGDFRSTEVKSDGQRYPSDVIYFKTAESEGEVFHPTQKPIELGQYLIRTYTKKGELVLDNTSGSGSFLVACALEGRNFIGIELNKETVLHHHKKVNLITVTKNRIKKVLPKIKIKVYANN